MHYLIAFYLQAHFLPTPLSCLFGEDAGDQACTERYKMTSSGCHIRQCDHGFYLSIKSTANIAIIFDLKQFSTKNFSFLTFLSQRRLPYTKNLPMAKNAARNSKLMMMTMLQVLWECTSIRVYFLQIIYHPSRFPKNKRISND